MNRAKGVASCLLLACATCGALFAQGVATEAKPIAFGTLDANQDGFLSPQEFQVWPRALKTKNTATRDSATVPGGSAGAQHLPAN
jgi:hypothetical protein